MVLTKARLLKHDFPVHDFPECFVQLFFSRILSPKTLQNAKFGAPTRLFSEVADRQNTKRRFLTALRKLLRGNLNQALLIGF